MHPRKFFGRRKAHLIFGGGFFLVLILNSTLNFIAGETALDAAWKSISEIKPFDFLMLVLFWYTCAVDRPKDDWRSPLTTLSLGRPINGK